MSSFSIALSGLSAASTDLDVTANNIANADTIGFKYSRAEFADLYSSGAADLNSSTTGEGVELSTNAQQFSQGNVTTTSANLDLAISGDGFFTLQDSSNGVVYSRNGQFQEDANGNVVSPTGATLQVYPPLTGGGFNTGATQALNLQTAQSAPQATGTDTGGTVILNLPANSSVPIDSTFDPTDSNSYTKSTSTTIYDSLGTAYPATMYFVATSNPLVWNVNTTIGVTTAPGVVTQEPMNVTNPPSNTLTFTAGGALQTNPNGALDGTGNSAVAGNLTFKYPADGTALPDGANALSFPLNFSKTTAFGGAFGVTSITQDGYATGQLSTVAIDATGIVSAVYTNGRSTQLGQLAMANFPNTQGLKQLGSTEWASSFDSGDVVEGTAGSASFGKIQSGALESSNVDLTSQLVNMITAQRSFDANAQVITTSNQESQTVIQMSR